MNSEIETIKFARELKYAHIGLKNGLDEIKANDNEA